MNVRRLWLFVRDLWSEIPAVWWIARTNDCERNGGHRWGDVEYDLALKGWGRECSRCKCWESVTTTTATATATGDTWTVYPTATFHAK